MNTNQYLINSTMRVFVTISSNTVYDRNILGWFKMNQKEC